MKTTALWLLCAAMAFVACSTGQKLESQDGNTFKTKQKEPKNVYYVTKYTYQNRRGKVYTVKLNHKGHAYYTPNTWYGGDEIYLPTVGKKINPDAYDKNKGKGEWKKHLRELTK